MARRAPPALWHAATLLREFRGDGHVSPLVAHGIDGCEAHVLVTAEGVMPAEAQRQVRGWSEEEWSAAGDTRWGDPHPGLTRREVESPGRSPATRSLAVAGREFDVTLLARPAPTWSARMLLGAETGDAGRARRLAGEALTAAVELGMARVAEQDRGILPGCG